MKKYNFTSFEHTKTVIVSVSANSYEEATVLAAKESNMLRSNLRLFTITI